MAGLVPAIHVFGLEPAQETDARHIGAPSGLAFGKPKDELHDAILRPAMAGHDEGSI
jgi:hypothetical protein